MAMVALFMAALFMAALALVALALLALMCPSGLGLGGHDLGLV